MRRLKHWIATTGTMALLTACGNETANPVADGGASDRATSQSQADSTFGTTDGGFPVRALRKAASESGIFWGAAAFNIHMDKPGYQAALAGHYTVMTAENELKFPSLQPKTGVFNFEPADRLADFARSNGMKMRGHVLIWREDLTPYLGANPTREAAIALMRNHIFTVMTHYRTKYPDVFIQWDVVNEAFRGDGTLRDSGWHKAIGDDFIELAFKFAHEAWPEMKLYYNDFEEIVFNTAGAAIDAHGQLDSDGLRPGVGPSFVYSDCNVSSKCVAIRNMATDFVKRGVPIHGIGFQGHIANALPPDFATHAKWVGPLGLQWAVTELDAPCPEDPGTGLREAVCFNTQANIYRSVISACRSDKACSGVVQWGVADPFSWWPGLTGGAFSKPLVLDDDFKMKPAGFAVLETLTAPRQ